MRFLRERMKALADSQLAKRLKRDKGLQRLLIVAGAVVVVVILLGLLLSGGKGDVANMSTYVVKRGPLTISVLEGGSIESQRSKDIKSQVEGQTTIISIVPEGTYITEEDVKKGKVLVELDSSNLRDQRTQQEISFENAQASFTQAKESFDIQVKQNESDIKQGELTVKFAKLELDKYLGAELAATVNGEESETTPTIDFLALGKDEALGGDALQRKRKLETDIDLAGEEVSRASDKLGWTNKLEQKGYVTRSELEADALSLKRREIELEQARAALELFLQYEFPKQVEKLLSDYQEAQRELERIEARARSQMAQKEADLRSKEATYKLQKSKLEKMDEQIENCIIKAPAPGLVAYGSSDDWHRRIEPIEEGATVRERQTIIQIPDTSAMAADIKVHESVIDKVKKGQKARITVDAFPDKELRGEVTKIGVLPDPQRWLNPDIKVYDTKVTIEGEHPFLKPGLSAQVEVIVKQLGNVLYVPIQAVTTRGEKRVCYVLASSKPEMRMVETGLSNEKFIEIKSGLKEGERVLLNPPELPKREEEVAAKEKEAEQEEAEAEKTETEETKTADTVSSSPTVIKSKEAEETPVAAMANIDELLEKVPAERREAIKKRWESMSEEERQQMLRQFQRMQRRGGRQGRPPGPPPQ